MADFIWDSSQLTNDYINNNIRPIYKDSIIIHVGPTMQLTGIYSGNSDIIKFSQVGNVSKLTRIKGNTTLHRYGGRLIEQSNNQITIKFIDNSFDIFSFNSFEEKYETTNMNDLSDELINRGLLKI